MVTVAVDAHGADLGAAEVAAGCVLAAEQGVGVLVFGDARELAGVADSPLIDVRHAPASVAKAPDPVRAVRSTPEASIVQAARAVAGGEADALVCGGSTGAALAAALFHIRRAKGIRRPALALPIPVPGAPVLLLDVGANVQARAEHLVQFAHMGAAFASSVLGVAEPRVALLSNGEEPARGTPEVQEAHAQLTAAPALRFAGNVEGTSLTAGAADVVVCDGFTGNVALKLMEGVSDTLIGAIRERAGRSPRAAAGGWLLRPALRGLRDDLDPERSGGAYLLGLRRLGVVCHGRFTRKGYASAIAVAARGAEQDAVGAMLGALSAAGALGRDAVASGSQGTVAAPAASVSERS